MHPDPIEDVDDENENTNLLSSEDLPKPNKRKFLGVVDLLFIVFFLVCGGAYGIEDLGSSIPPLYSLLGVILCPWLYGLPLALITAELATAMPVQEGFVFWARKAWGKKIGFFEGWLVVLVVMIDKALYPVIFISYLEVLLEYTFAFWEKFGINLLFVSFCFLVTILGPTWIGNSSKLFALAVFIPMTIFTVLCFAAPGVDLSRWGTTEGDYDGLTGIQLYSSVLLWLYSGYDYSGFLAGSRANQDPDETKDPERTYPRTMVLSIIINMFVYLLPLAAALSFTIDPTYFSEGSFPKIADALGWGSWLGYILTVGALFSNLGVYLVYIHTSSNALSALSERGDAPLIFSLKLQHFKTPWVSVLFYSVTTQIWTMFDFSVIVEVETVLYCVHVIILITSFFRLRHRFPDMERPFRIPGPFPLLVVGGGIPILIALVNIGFTGWFQIVLSFAIMVMVVLCYFIKCQYDIFVSFDKY